MLKNDKNKQLAYLFNSDISNVFHYFGGGITARKLFDGVRPEIHGLKAIYDDVFDTVIGIQPGALTYYNVSERQKSYIAVPAAIASIYNSISYSVVKTEITNTSKDFFTPETIAFITNLNLVETTNDILNPLSINNPLNYNSYVDYTVGIPDMMTNVCLANAIHAPLLEANLITYYTGYSNKKIRFVFTKTDLV